MPRRPAGPDAAAGQGAGADDAYRCLHHLTGSSDVAGDLTVEVVRRLARREPGWLATNPPDVQWRFHVVQVVLEHRGLLPPRTTP